MDLQKKRIPNKKTKQGKTELPLDMPLAPLIQQINQLKTQLATIKSKKNIKTNKQIQQAPQKSIKQIQLPLNLSKSEAKQNKTLNKFSIQIQDTQEVREIYFPIKQNQLKINTQLRNLVRALQQKNMNKSINCLNFFIDCLNVSINLLEARKFSIEYPNNNFQYQSVSSLKEQAKIHQQINNQLQKQNIEYKHLMAKQMDQIEHLNCINIQIKQQNQQLARALFQSEEQLQKVRLVCGGLRDQRQQLQEKMKIYERSIEKKQSELLLYEEDIKFSKMETEKNKSQKRQLQKMLDNLHKDYRELKGKYQIQLQYVMKQKNKWKLQCQNRRSQQKQTINSCQLVNQLRKQIQFMRKQYDLLNETHAQKKQMLCNQQKKNMKLEQQNYLIANQRDKLMKNVQFCKSELRQMEKQVEQLRQQSKKYREAVVKSKLGVKNTSKTEALRQIQQLIQKHKQSELNIENE